MNVAQHKIVNLLKTLWDFFITCHIIFNVWPKTTLLLPVWPRDTKVWTHLHGDRMVFMPCVSSSHWLSVGWIQWLTAHKVSSHWRWPHGKDLRSAPANSLPWWATKQMLPRLQTTAAPRELLDCNFTKALEPEPSCPKPQKWEEITNVCCSKLLNLGGLCYSSIIHIGAKWCPPQKMV